MGAFFEEANAHVFVLHMSCIESNLSEALQQFWDLDSIGISDPSSNDELGNEVI